MGLKPVSVSRLNAYIKRILQSDPILGNVSVVGEISNLKYHSSGHIYFSLKDQNSKINCFLPADERRHLRYELNNGMEITAVGFIYLYERGGSYSLNVRDVTVSGLGDLQIAFQQLKDKLEKEGLFDPRYKKELPFFPEKVAVLTSASGAAVRDVLKIIRSRNQYVDVLVCPCLVQGPDAAGDIARTIEAVNRRFPQVDVMIVGRGGGSMEELWAFNEEIVARSIFLSKIPVISAVGHETDFTIADFVADRRAETPTAAAQMAVPDTGLLLSNLVQMKEKMAGSLGLKLRLSQLMLDRWSPSQLQRMLTNKAERSQRLLEGKGEQLRRQMEKLLRDREQKVALWERQLQVKNPSLVLERGCGILYDENGKSICSVSDTGPGQRIRVRLTDGLLHCCVNDVESVEVKERREKS